MRNKIYQHDVMVAPWPQADQSVDCIVTSPPYWGLRDYDSAGQLGMEASPEEYVANVLAWSRECARVLKPWGTFWLVIADTYWGGKGQSGGSRMDLAHSSKTLYGQGQNFLVKGQKRPQDGKHPYIKKKDLVGIPWMCAFALRNDGWYLRNDIIWAKPNPLPESMDDRCTKSHEHIFLLSKSDDYFYDATAIEELANFDGRKKMTYEVSQKYANVEAVPGTKAQSMSTNGGQRWRTNANGEPIRNKRDVWTVATKGYEGAHFATYPEELITPCVLAGTSAHGNCGSCGRPWKRNLEQDSAGNEVTTCWGPTCECKNAEILPPIVGDPFMGAGTTALVALSNGRDFTGLELNQANIEMAHNRLQAELGMFYTAKISPFQTF